MTIYDEVLYKARLTLMTPACRELSAARHATAARTPAKVVNGLMVCFMVWGVCLGIRACKG